MIVENKLCRVDSDSFLINILEVIIDYVKDDTIFNITNKYFITPKGR